MVEAGDGGCWQWRLLVEAGGGGGWWWKLLVEAGGGGACVATSTSEPHLTFHGGGDLTLGLGYRGDNITAGGIQF